MNKNVLQRWSRAISLATASVLALIGSSSALAQNLVVNGDFTQFIAPTAKDPNTGLPYTSSHTYQVSTAGGQLKGWTQTPDGIGPYVDPNNSVGQVTTGNDNDTMYQAYLQQSASVYNDQNCCFKAWSYNNLIAAYNADPVHYLPPSQITNTWDGRGPNGANFFATDPGWYGANLSQTVTGLQKGQQYTLSFEWAAGQLTDNAGATTAGWNIHVNNQSFSTGSIAVESHGFSGWMEASYTFVASGTSTLLTFSPMGTGTPPLTLLSSISVTAVPEPATFLMFGLGLGALMFLRRQTR